jgi:hypothetical protein
MARRAPVQARGNTQAEACAPGTPRYGPVLRMALHRTDTVVTVDPACCRMRSTMSKDAESRNRSSEPSREGRPEDKHSGEGAASALARLRSLERARAQGLSTRRRGK